MVDAWAAKHVQLLEKPPKRWKGAVKLGSKIARLQMKYVEEFLRASRGFPPLQDEVMLLVFLWNATGSIFIDAAARGASLEDLAVLAREVFTPLGLAELELRADLANGVRELCERAKKKKGLLSKLFSR